MTDPDALESAVLDQLKGNTYNVFIGAIVASSTTRGAFTLEVDELRSSREVGRRAELMNLYSSALCELKSCPCSKRALALDALLSLTAIDEVAHLTADLAL